MLLHMKVGVYGLGAHLAPKSVIRQMELGGIDAFQIGSLRPDPRDADIVIALGGDRGVRSYLHKVTDSEIPVLGIGEAESSGLLAHLDLRELGSHIDRLIAKKYTIDAMPRIGIKIDGKEAYPVLNDIAVFASRSAILMEHQLLIDGKEVWHDNGDGIIISTPMGSSAYSMSAGGPVIFSNTKAFCVISVNSLDITRRPVIVPNTSTIEISSISSKTNCVAVLDGIDRRTVKRAIICTRTAHPANIIRMKSDTLAISALAKKVHLAGDLLKMSPSSKLILKTLEYGNSPMTQREIGTKTLLPPRTMRFALKHLLDKGYLKKRVSSRDARQSIYEITRLV